MPKKETVEAATSAENAAMNTNTAIEKVLSEIEQDREKIKADFQESIKDHAESSNARFENVDHSVNGLHSRLGLFEKAVGNIQYIGSEEFQRMLKIAALEPAREVTQNVQDQITLARDDIEVLKRLVGVDVDVSADFQTISDRLSEIERLLQLGTGSEKQQ